MAESVRVSRGMTRPSMRDAAVLIAGTALGLAGLRAVAHGLMGIEPTDLLSHIASAPEQGWNRREVAFRLADITMLILTFTGGWTLVLPLYRRGRTWRRSALQPGRFTCLAACVGMVLGAVAWGFSVVTGSWFAGFGRMPIERAIQHHLVNQLIPQTGFAVAIVWSLLTLSGRWGRSRDWPDRVGVGVGAIWIAAGLAWSIRNFIL